MRVLMPLPARDFDPTESAVPWRLLVDHGHEVVFATPDGDPAAADERVLTGRGFGPFRPLLRARADARELYAGMIGCPAFQQPARWSDAGAVDAAALVLPGGHAPGMRPYLESPELQALVAGHVVADRPVAAICHGVLLVARSSPQPGGRSVLAGRQSTALLRSQELGAWMLTRAWLGSYYRTYPETVQDEVSRALGAPERFIPGPTPILRDAPDELTRGFVVRDGAYLSARWPGDAFRFGTELCAMLA